MNLTSKATRINRDIQLGTANCYSAYLPIAQFSSTVFFNKAVDQLSDLYNAIHRGGERFLNEQAKWYQQRIGEACRVIAEHTDLLSNFFLLVLNTCFVAGKAFSQIPPQIGRSALVLLSFVGVIYLNFEVSLIGKTVEDASLAWRAGSGETFVLTTAKVLYLAVGVLLTLGGLLAAVATLCEQVALAQALYSYMRPIGVVSVGVAIALDIGYYVLGTSVVSQLDLMAKRRGVCSEAREIFETLMGARRGRDASLSLGARVRACIDKYTLETLLVKLKRLSSWSRGQINKLFYAMRKNVETQLEGDRNSLGLRAIGYGAMTLCKMCPDTLIQAIVMLGMCLLHTSKLLYQKVQQAHHRRQISIVN